MKEMKKETLEFLRKAEADYNAINYIHVYDTCMNGTNQIIRVAHVLFGDVIDFESDIITEVPNAIQPGSYFLQCGLWSGLLD